jgi:hypothetical protein
MQRLKIAAVTAALAACSLLAQASPPATSTGNGSSRAQLSRAEMRASVLGFLDDGSARGADDKELRAHLKDWVLAYRVSDRPLPPGAVTIENGPYLGLVIQQKLGELYPVLYDSTYAAQYDEYVVHPKLELIFDQFIDGYLEGSLPPDLQRSASALGACLARKVQRGKSDGCVLDESAAINKPGRFKLFEAKLGCRFPLPGACATRQLVFNEAKEDLIKARAGRALEGPFKELFPKKFREEFSETIFGKRVSFSKLVAQKFRGELSPLWGAQTPLVETEETSPSSVTLRGFAEGLRADLSAATRFAVSQDATERGAGAALFYAAANRLLLLTGGTQAQWDGQRFVTLPGDAFDPREPKRPPRFQAQAFGGWSFGSESGHHSSYSPWDWGGYDLTRASNPSSLRLFPGLMTLGASGVPVPVRNAEPRYLAESLEDLAGLLEGLSEFLKDTRPQAVFGPHFGSAQDLGAILDGASPVIFPREGRALAVGAMGGVLKNLVAPGIGHLEQTNPGSPQGGLGLAFHDSIRLDTRDGPQASVQAVAHVLVAASQVRDAVVGDADVPAELTALLPQIDSALQAGALTLSAQAQSPDGGFASHLTLPQAPATPPPGRALMDTLRGLRALGRAYDASHILVLKLSLKLGWDYLDRSWGDAVLPPHLALSDLWECLRLWNETQRSVRPDLASDLDWVKWEKRMASLRERLFDSLRSGRQPFLE